MRRRLRDPRALHGVAVAFALAIAATIAACGAITSGPERTGDVFDKVRAVDLLPRYPQSTEPVATTGGEGTKPASFYGSEPQVVAPAQRSASGEGYELNFENTPVTTVAKVVLGDIMGLGYTIDPRVQGTVSLASGRPVPKSDILFVLENALRVSNVVLVRDARGYRLIPAAEAIGTGSVDSVGNPEAGYGVSVVPLQYVSAPTVLKLLDSFATKPGMVRADPTRNLILVQGNGSERRSAVDTVLTFDQDWMKGQSVGIYPVRNSTPEPVIAEIEKIMDAGEGGLSQNLLKLQPIARQNAIMIVTRKPELLRTAATWITRLDTSDTAATGVKVYRVRYGDAKQLASLLNDMFIGKSGGTFDSPTNQLAPGSGATTLSGGSGAGGGFGSQAGGGLASTFSGRQQLAAAGGAGGLPAGTPGGGFGSPTAGGGGGFGSGTSSGASLGTPGGAGGLGGAPGTLGGAGGPATFGGGTQAILPGIRITADIANNTLLIYANQENYRIIERTLNQLDRPQLQVAIDATIAEVVLNNNLNYGVQVFLQSSDVGLGRNKGSINLTNLATSAVLARALPGFNFLAGSEANPRVILSALQSVTDVKVLSSPSLVVIDNQVATLQVGDQIPVATRSAVSVDAANAPVVNNIDYKNTGIILRVAPRINTNGNVLLDIEQEISNVANAASATLTPTVSQRRVKSSISVASGQTVLLGGLIAERMERDKSGLPLLDKIGALTELLGNNSGTVKRTELIIFIRPQIIRDGVDAQRVAEELRSRLGNRLGTFEPQLPRVLPRTPESTR
ncbi:MAG: type II secretion system secretin GspD [Xanthobacteraceae bacterium]